MYKICLPWNVLNNNLNAKAKEKINLEERD
jgi:hypothetical protein